MSFFRIRTLRRVAWMAAMIACGSAHADDIEVYQNASTAPVAPNVMFLLDLSGSMNWAADGGTASSTNPARLDIVKKSIADLLDDPDLPDVRIGFAQFQSTAPEGPHFPIADVNADAYTIDPDIPTGTTVREVIKYLVDDSSAWGGTPTVDAMHEMALYFRGEGPPNTWLDTFGSWDTSSNAYEGEVGYRAPHPASHTGTFVNVDPSQPGYSQYCYDYTPTYPGDPNDCQDAIDAGVPMECEFFGNRVCTTTTCDSDCGTRFVCPVAEEYTEPSGCLQDSFGNTWVTGTSGGVPSQCCSASDSAGLECVSYLSYPSSCPVAEVEECKTYNDREAHNRCRMVVDDQRQYTSPIVAQCQKSALVLLTDGDPGINTTDQGEVSGTSAQWPYAIREMIAASDPTKTRDDIVCQDMSPVFGQPAGSKDAANCGVELARFMAQNDQVASIPGSRVNTHTIGFAVAGPAWNYLQRIAEAGEGQAYEANSADGLISSFKQIINSVTSTNQSFQAVTTSFDATRLQTSDRAFMTLFKPSDKRQWSGNLKGYFLRKDGLHDVQDRIALTNAPSGEVVFRPIAQSFWSTMSDGNDPLAGGFANAFTPSSRPVYTITDPTETSNVDLADGNHAFAISNAGLTAALLGMPGTATVADRDALIDWARSNRVGDPLHTRPQVVEYGGSTGNVLFFSTNQGLLHAVDINLPAAVGDSSGGDELFAFMPRRLLANVYQQSLDQTGASHIYGLDGTLTVWRQDKDNDGVINNADKVYLYLGMRRGGTAYYAFDVTDPTQPVLMWQIDETVAGFAALGQTWSGLRRATIDDNGTLRDVLIFGGGYDADQDTAGTVRNPAGDDQGLGVYIIDAHTGALLTSVGPGTPAFTKNAASMIYSIPADIRITDSDSNGIDDRLYFGDMGGQLWRIDIKEGAAITNPAALSAYRIADLGLDASGAATAASNRRFYYAPSVARVSRGGQLVYALSIGSGYRAHPLNADVDDKLFVVFDEHPDIGAPTLTPSLMNLSALYDASANLLETGDSTQQAAALGSLKGKSGWWIDLAPKEKVLARVRIFRNRLFATTFTPEAGDVCSGGAYTNRLYAVNLLDATSALPSDVDGDGIIAVGEKVRFETVVDQAAILDEPVIVTYHDDGNPNPPPGDDPEPPTTCSAIYTGAQEMMAICSAPVKVNWLKTR